MPDAELTTVVVTLFVGIAGVVGTLVAAFAGSYFAYHLNARREDKKLHDERAVAGNKALFTLVQQLNRLCNIRNQFIDPERENPVRALTMHPALPHHGAPLTVDMESLAFLLEPESNLCMKLMLEQDRYEIAEAGIKERSRLHHDEVQPALERAGFVERSVLTLQDMEGMLGPRLFASIDRATEQMIEVVDRAIMGNATMQEALWAALKTQFPERKFVKAKDPRDGTGQT